ncbi:NAD(P)-dependent oxidoreductase [Maridesulfovibrio salexigens]|uniref:6-phosphogluconate dehydrogenase NAD-binding n=1 Tax=Maridesulfovibrio salexigens (strain ATCC 14822 / DSM 2638 / NCIMB 8403 / VKM B-1763) TaxID=526222 RepID=C6BU83_MARSD|nr:6-phosphogluconate dehydrogenase NAD-binding [Maridesulfovibrio salexigens DSM 2638]
MSMKIGWIGTGVMGGSMCMHLMKAGNEAFVYNRTKSKADKLLAEGATWCASPAEVAKKADIIFTIVGYPTDVEQTILGENGVLANADSGKIIVDMTTSEPALAKRIAEEATAKGVGSLDAPVSGGDLGARNATLAIMVGGEKKIFDEVMPLFDVMGNNIQLMGKAGAGQHTKMCNQILIAGTMIGTVESLLYAYKAGMDLNEVIDVIGSGAAGSWSINNLGRRIADDDFNPGFFIKHFVKDMGIALDEAKRMNLSLPGLALVNQFYISAMALGYEELGTQALYKVLEKMNGK